jgi:hypothetical protein
MQHTPDPADNTKPTDPISGPQGTDKDPSEDPADNPSQDSDIQQTQKAKKVDADPEEESKKSGES